MNPQKVCKNCDNIFEGNYCNLCGQNARTHKINFGFVISELQNSIFNVDRGFFFTIKELFRRPGDSMREFIEGKRVSHYKPFSFVIILSVILSLLEHEIGKNAFIEDGLQGVLEGIRGRDGKGNFAVFEWLIHHYEYSALLSVPIFSFASFLAFRKAKYNYFEHLTLNTFLFGQITVILILTLPLYFVFPNNDIGAYLRLMCIPIFTMWAYFQFFNNIRGSSRIFNTAITYVLFTLFLMTALFILVLFSVKLKSLI